MLSKIETMRMAFVLGVIILALSGCGGQANTSITPQKPVANTTPSAVSTSPELQTVSITSPDGTILVGTFLESPKPGSGAVLFLHQWQSDRHSYDEFAQKMQAKGFNVLAIDGRGFGGSTEKTDGTTVTVGRTDADVKAMLGDVGAAFDFLSKQKNVDPARIGIVGASYGSSLAIIYSADNPKVKAVALLSPGLNYFGNMPTEPAIEKYGSRPLFLIAAEDDKESATSVRKLASHGANDSKWQMTVFDKGGHGTGLFGAKVGLDDLLEQFLSSNV